MIRHLYRINSLDLPEKEKEYLTGLIFDFGTVGHTIRELRTDYKAVLAVVENFCDQIIADVEVFGMETECDFSMLKKAVQTVRGELENQGGLNFIS